LAAFVSDHDDGPEAHFLTALNGFGDTADLNHTLLPLGVAFLAASIAATSTATTAVTFPFAAATPSFLLAFGRGWNIGGTWNDAGLNLVVGFGHGESRDQN